MNTRVRTCSGRGSAYGARGSAHGHLHTKSRSSAHLVRTPSPPDGARLLTWLENGASEMECRPPLQTSFSSSQRCAKKNNLAFFCKVSSLSEVHPQVLVHKSLRDVSGRFRECAGVQGRDHPDDPRQVPAAAARTVLCVLCSEADPVGWDCQPDSLGDSGKLTRGCTGPALVGCTPREKRAVARCDLPTRIFERG